MNSIVGTWLSVEDNGEADSLKTDHEELYMTFQGVWMLSRSYEQSLNGFK